MIRGMEARLGGKMDRVDVKIINLEQRMDKGDDEFEAKVVRILEKQKQQPPPPAVGVDPMIAAAFGTQGSAPTAAGPSSTMAKTDRQEAQFYKCRRSLRLYPVKGPDLQAGFNDFIRNKLKMDSDYREGLGVVSLRRFRGQRSISIFHEFL